MSVVLSFNRALRLLFLFSLVLVASCARHRTMSAEECMTRVMYFESNRSSAEGMLAVGTVVMNRVKSGKYPKTVCAVVAQKNQFAPGVLSKPMGRGRELANKTARVVLKGRKHPAVGKAMFFHTAGYSYPYSNMQYVAILGGNAFYEKRKNATSTQASVLQRQAEREGRLPYDPPERHPPAEQRVQAFQPAPVQPATVPAPVPVQQPVAPAPLPPMSIDEIIQRRS